MPLTAGNRLRRYEIVAPIGAGGMGEVYCACGELPSYLEAPLGRPFGLLNEKRAKS